MYEKIKEYILIGVIGILIVFQCIFAGTTIYYKRQLGNSLQTIERYRDAESKVRESSERIGTRLGDMSDCLSQQRSSIGELRSLLKEMEDYYNSLWDDYNNLVNSINSSNDNVSEGE
jgi:methyl-accepting chemotaxis protein